MFTLTIQTPRLLLRSLSFEDAKQLAQLTNDVAIARMMATIPHPFGFGDALAVLGEYEELARQGTGAGLAITKISGRGTIMGVVSYSLMAPRADIGFWLGSQHRGKGYAKEAVTAIVNHVMGRPDVAYITAGAFADNTASLALQESLGFEKTGQSKRLNRFRGGPTDHIDMVYRRR